MGIKRKIKYCVWKRTKRKYSQIKNNIKKQNGNLPPLKKKKRKVCWGLKARKHYLLRSDIGNMTVKIFFFLPIIYTYARLFYNWQKTSYQCRNMTFCVIKYFPLDAINFLISEKSFAFSFLSFSFILYFKVIILMKNIRIQKLLLKDFIRKS